MDASFLNSSNFNLPSPLSTSTSYSRAESQPSGSLGWTPDEHGDCKSGQHTAKAVPTKTASVVGKKRAAAAEQARLLACTSCRQKKIKCQRESGPCKRCRKLKLQCITPEGDGRKIPSSKTHVWMLHQRIQLLERELETHGLRVPVGPGEVQAGLSPTHEPADSSSPHSRRDDFHSPSLIGRLCSRKPQLSTDHVGRLHFFGPTSSLHTAESTTSFLTRWGDVTTNEQHGSQQLVDEIPLRLQEYLLDRYWKFQHTVIHVIHKEAFLHDMRSRRCRYYSKGLLYSIFACGARISEFAELRALVLRKGEEHGDMSEEPYLLKKARTLVEEELAENAGITTVQALQLLSIIYCCAFESDNKGWMDSGRAIRLAFELGLHQDVSDLQPMHLSQMDLEVRKAVFWGCFTLDRKWALYLGRPYSIRLEDITVTRPAADNDTHNWDMLMADAWSGLLEIVGRICDALNQKLPVPSHSLNDQLQAWESRLDPEVRCTANCPPSVYILHMQYCSAVILTQRPAACFGTFITAATTASLKSRKICVESAIRLARITQDYRSHHGPANTMLGTSLYNITIAVIVLIANWADGSSIDDETQYLSYIDSCMRSIKEMEHSYIVAQTVGKQLTYLMRRCNFPRLPSEKGGARDDVEGDDNVLFQLGHALPLSPAPEESDGFLGHQDFLLMMSECDALRSVGPWTYPMNHPIL